MNVPFLDLNALHSSEVGDKIFKSIREVFEDCAFAGGKYVERFEKEFAAYCGAKYAVGVGSGTEALWLSLKAVGIKNGDKVIIPPNTFIATAEAVSLCGAIPVFVDIDGRTYNINPSLIEEAVDKDSSIKAIIPVHLFGQCADMNPIMDIAKKYGLFVIEDSCQAHGCEYFFNGKNVKAGSIGDLGCFSFYPGKNLGACGEAGIVITSKAEFAEKIYQFRDHGQKKKYEHEVIGINSRMDGIQGAILSEKLRYLDDWNWKRQVISFEYLSLISSEKIEAICPFTISSSTHVYHIFPIRVNNRDQILLSMKDKGVVCGIHYPIPIHLQKAYEWMSIPVGSFLISERSANELLSLPMYPDLTKKQIAYVIDSLKNSLDF